MPLDVLGRTRATLKESACPPWPSGPGNPLNLLRARDWGLQLFPMNEEFPFWCISGRSDGRPSGLENTAKLEKIQESEKSVPQINELVFVKTNQIPSAKPFKRSCRIIKCTSIANTKRTSLTKDLVNKFKNYRTTSNRGTLSRTKTQETTKKQVTEEKKDPKEEMATSNIEVMDQDGFQMAKVSKKSGSENIIDARGRAGTSSGIPTSNVFEIFKRPDLQNSGNENPTQQEKKTRIPPIVLQNGIGHYTNLVKNLTALLGHKNFSIAPAGKSGTRVFTTSMDDFNKVKENLVKENLGFHTFSQKEVITKKIIMRAAPRMDLNEVTQEMRDAGIEAKITALKPKSGLDGSTYLVQVPKSQDLKDIKKITGVQNIRVRLRRISETNNIVRQLLQADQYTHRRTGTFLAVCHTHKPLKTPINHDRHLINKSKKK
ncbi:unnamed protein product [Phyllotreta striolata]|uniref:Pre-C2HC domain-containing protein n=1 Tax=Phyllotreta striolata TaxID=444603 RepID=A0A9P0DSI1_PHYSR|nr:unnamed protein product [Phyllotreta striolata]